MLKRRSGPRLPKSGTLPYPKPKDALKRPSSAFKMYPDGREVCSKTAAGRNEYRQRTLDMLERQKWICPACNQYMTVLTATFQHGDTRGMGGGRRNDRIDAPGNCAMHALCNAKIGSRRIK